MDEPNFTHKKLSSLNKAKKGNKREREFVCVREKERETVCVCVCV